MSGDENDQKRPAAEVTPGDSEKAGDLRLDNEVPVDRIPQEQGLGAGLVGAPRVDAPRVDTPRADTPRGGTSRTAAPREESLRDDAPRTGAPTFSLGRTAKPKVVKEVEPEEEDDEDSEPSDDESHELLDENLDFVSDDPLAPAYDLERGAPLDKHALPDRLPWRSEVRSAKEFFTTEILYRFDIIEPPERLFMVGRYRIELRGANGGVWTLVIGEEMEVFNQKEDADIVLIMQHRDFMQIVNGVLNPQLAILAQKVRVHGDVKKAILLQSVLAPLSE